MLKLLTPIDFPKKYDRKAATLRIHKSGSITISRPAGEIMKVRPGDQLSFSFDEKKNTFLIGKATKTMSGFPIGTWANRKDAAMRLHNSGLAFKIAETLKVDLNEKISIAFELRVEFPVTEYGTTYFGLVAKF